MKKFIVAIVTVFIMIFAFSSCKCQQDVVPTPETVDPLVVENLISADKEWMFLNYGENYRYYETTAVYDNFFDADTTHNIVSVSNVFFAVTEITETGGDADVIYGNHSLTANEMDVRKHSFWVGDYPLNNDKIILTVNEAYAKMMEANVVKPHSKYVVLRRELGPLDDVNPQYIFGNAQCQVYVDATTGAVSAINPAYPPDKQLNYAFSW